MKKSIEELAGLKALFQDREIAESAEPKNDGKTKRVVKHGKKHQSDREFMLFYSESLRSPMARYRHKKSKGDRRIEPTKKSVLKGCEVSQIEAKGGHKVITLKKKDS